jgi:hypothetical protein
LMNFRLLSGSDTLVDDARLAPRGAFLDNLTKTDVVRLKLLEQSLN